MKSCSDEENPSRVKERMLGFFLCFWEKVRVRVSSTNKLEELFQLKLKERA